MPNLFVIAGPNGAGKTAYARRFLAADGEPLPEEMSAGRAFPGRHR
jgi:ABC-type molybdenum transport system ATPase subunit/photorepair protein PhrA